MDSWWWCYTTVPSTTAYTDGIVTAIAKATIIVIISLFNDLMENQGLFEHCLENHSINIPTYFQSGSCFFLVKLSD